MGEYAVRAMMCLASLPPDSIVQISQMSKRWDIPDNILRKIIPLLAKAGFVYSYRGTGGGVRLAKPAETITLLHIVEAVEGRIYLNKCLMSGSICERSDYCAVHAVWHEAQNKIKQTLNSKSIAELSEISEEQQGESASDHSK